MDGSHTLPDIIIVVVGDVEEFNPSQTQFRYGADDIISSNSNVLYTGSIVEVEVFFDLCLLLPFSPTQKLQSM